MVAVCSSRVTTLLLALARTRVALERGPKSCRRRRGCQEPGRECLTTVRVVNALREKLLAQPQQGIDGHERCERREQDRLARKPADALSRGRVESDQRHDERGRARVCHVAAAPYFCPVFPIPSV